MSAATPAPTTDQPSGLLVIFGITGDLAHRYLLPALYHLDRAGLLPEAFEIIGATRRGAEVPALLESIAANVKAHGNTADPAVLERLGRRLRIVTMDPTKAEDYARLKSTLDAVEDERKTCLNRLFYLSIPPQIYGPVVDLLGASGLNSGCQHGTAVSRIMVEKPFGYDLASATELIARLHHSFKESQIYRIDHYLAKETAQNILTFRFANPIFQSIWDRRHVTSINITAVEAIGIEGRAGFYDSVGALRDFIQNHLLQLLAVTTMDKPGTFDSHAVHTAKLALLKAIVPIKPNEVEKVATRGQYRGYREDAGNPDSTTETFARLNLTINNERWQGVPITLQTGKHLDQRATNITLAFATNTLTFRIQPNEGVTIELQAKKPGLDNQMQTVEMAFNYSDSFNGSPTPDAYERVLADAIRGDQTLFATSDEVLTSWDIVDAVVGEWAKSGSGLITYEPGTSAASIGDSRKS